MTKSDPIVEITDLEFRWNAAGPPILVIDRLAVNRGERLFVQGASGSGKSTLLGLIGGVCVPQAGSVRVLGNALQERSGAMRDRFRADHIGFLFQMFNLLPYMSTVENVTLPCRFSAARRSKALQRSGSLEAEARRLLAHLDLGSVELLGRPVTELSVGQQQRVAAARALIGAPALIVADEPTSALDSNRRIAFLQLLERECIQQGITLVFVSHDLSLTPLFDRTVSIVDVNRAANA